MIPIPVFTITDTGVHDSDLGIHVPPILLFTIHRSRCSGSADARTSGDGFDLHANMAVPGGDQRRLERALRHALRESNRDVRYSIFC